MGREHSAVAVPVAKRTRRVREHTAILLPRYLELVASGVKTVESRLTLTRREPWGLVHAGDVVFFVGKGGVGCVRCTVSRVVMHEQLDRRAVLELRERHNTAICGSDEYWLSKIDARYATLMWLRDALVCAKVPPYRKLASWTPGRAWFVME
jgi:ASC-1-like (ASCH) protein